jgi:hypothetical protein
LAGDPRSALASLVLGGLPLADRTGLAGPSGAPAYGPLACVPAELPGLAGLRPGCVQERPLAPVQAVVEGLVLRAGAVTHLAELGAPLGVDTPVRAWVSPSRTWASACARLARRSLSVLVAVVLIAPAAVVAAARNRSCRAVAADRTAVRRAVARASSQALHR